MYQYSFVYISIYHLCIINVGMIFTESWPVTVVELVIPVLRGCGCGELAVSLCVTPARPGSHAVCGVLAVLATPAPGHGEAPGAPGVHVNNELVVRQRARARVRGRALAALTLTLTGFTCFLTFEFWICHCYQKYAAFIDVLSAYQSCYKGWQNYWQVLTLRNI